MQPVREKRWSIRECDPLVVERLVKGGVASPLPARLLANRGVCDPAGASRFLASTLAQLHDPFQLLGMERAVERLVAAAVNGEKVCVHGDYDVDGITSVALLISFFRSIGLDSFYYIPNRLVDGYGLSADGVERAAAKGARLMVTVDCGITAVDEARLCSAAGIDLIVTDHHMPAKELPAACAVINPLQPGCPFPFKSLAGVGVAFKLMIALRSRLRAEGFFNGRAEPNLREYLDLVALGTVADVVPLTDENRVFVKHGLRELTNSRRPGVQALKAVAGVNGEVGCGVVGFRLAPRLNAAGRLEHAALGVELLLCSDRKRADEMAAELDASNAERQAVEREMLHDALEMVKETPALRNRKSIVLASEAWHPGVIGIVASRLVDLFHRPTILIAMQEGNGKGSGRSIANFHLHDALMACTELLVKFGGHKHAAGLSIAEETLEAFVERFDEVAAGLLTFEDLTPLLLIDGELEPAEITSELVDTVEALKPFGMGNPEPVFLLRNAAVVDCRTLKETHLKLCLSASGRTFEAIGFSMAGRAAKGDLLDVVFSPAINVWNGKTSLQLTIKDLRKAGE
jgi:single-stranded-DNA-specific exonuclease